MSVQLHYGFAGRFDCDLDPGRIVCLHEAPQAINNLEEHVRAALVAPLEFPPLGQALIPEDHVVLAVDRHTPQSPLLIAEIWRILAERGVEASRVQILQPVALGEAALADPRSLLPTAIRDEIRWMIHDPTDERRQAYLATTARGERIYLDRDVVEADVVVTVGQTAFDPLLGYRGTNSVLYPGLSTAEAIGRARGEGHSELGPDDERPLRQTIDEVAWLLGTQFSLQVIPAGGAGVADVVAGAYDAVYRRSRQLATGHWHVGLDQRVETVIAAVDADSAGHGWNQAGAALSAARNLVTRGGKIIVLTELDAKTEDGMELIRASRSPRSALLPIRKQAPIDLIPATQLASATDWANVYIVSRLANDVVEELFMTALESEREVSRLVAGDESCAILASAQHAHAAVARH